MQNDLKTNQRFAAQLPRNLIANIVYFIINIIIGILLVPYFISTLGVAAYGLIPLATSITGYVAIVVQSLNTSVSRYLTVDLQQEDYDKANKTFNTAIFGLSAIIVLMVPIVAIVAYFIPKVFNIPIGQERNAILLFLGVCAAFLIRSWSGNFTVQLFAFNRLDLQNIVNITNILVQTGLIILFFWLYGPDLAFVGLAYIIGAISASIVAIVLAKKVCPYLRVSKKSFDMSQLKDLSSMGGWVVVNQIGSLLFLQIDLIIVNMLFGAASTGEYAIALQWVVLLRGVADVLSGVLTPMIFIYYAKGQIETLIKIITSAVKLMGLAMALPIGLICGFAPQILAIWLDDKFVFLAPLMILLIIHLTLNLAVLPLFAINVTYNKVRIPGIITLIMGIGNFFLAIILPLLMGWGYYGVAAAGAIVLTLKNAIFTPWYTAKIIGIGSFTFIKSILPGIAITIALIAGITVIKTFIPVESLISLILISCILVTIYLIVIWKLGLSSFERDIFVSYLPKSIRSHVI